MCVLKAEGLQSLKIGIPIIDDVFPGFQPSDFATIYGNEAPFLGFILCVRCVSPLERDGLGHDVAFIDGGNSFNPYIIADYSRILGLDPKTVLGRIHVSRAFTAYQLSALILEKLEGFLDGHNVALVIVSDMASLFMDRDIPKKEAQDLFLKVCHKLAEISKNKQKIILATYHPDRSSRRGVFFEAALFGQITILIKFERKNKIFRFALQDHPRIKPFELEIPTEDLPLTNFMEV